MPLPTWHPPFSSFQSFLGGRKTTQEKKQIPGNGGSQELFRPMFPWFCLFSLSFQWEEGQKFPGTLFLGAFFSYFRWFFSLWVFPGLVRTQIRHFCRFVKAPSFQPSSTGWEVYLQNQDLPSWPTRIPGEQILLEFLEPFQGRKKHGNEKSMVMFGAKFGWIFWPFLPQNPTFLCAVPSNCPELFAQTFAWTLPLPCFFLSLTLRSSGTTEQKTTRDCRIFWEFPNLVVSNLVASNVYAEMFFCCCFCTFLLSFADLRLRSFAFICVFLRPTASKTTAFGSKGTADFLQNDHLRFFRK